MDENQFEETTSTAAPEVEAPAQEEKEQAAPEEAHEAEATADGEGEEPSEGEPEEKPEPKWKPKGPPETVPYAEFSKSRAEIRQLREQLEALQSGRTTPVEQGQQPAAQDPTAAPRPKMEDFPTFDAYEEAKDAWLVQSARTQALAEFQQHGQAQQQAIQREQIVTSFAQKLNEAEASNPEVRQIRDYLAPVFDHLHPAIQRSVAQAPNPADLLRAIAEIGDDAAHAVHSLNSDPSAALMYLGRFVKTGKQESPKPAAPLPIIPPTTTVKSARGLKNETTIDSLAKKSGYEFE